MKQIISASINLAVNDKKSLICEEFEVDAAVNFEAQIAAISEVLSNLIKLQLIQDCSYSN